MTYSGSFKKGIVSIGMLMAIFSQPVLAGDGLFGWIYTLDLQPKGKWEFEQRLQLNKQQAAGTYDSWFSRSEIEYGLTNDLQVAAYLNSYYVSANEITPIRMPVRVSLPARAAIPFPPRMILQAPIASLGSKVPH
jgi:hypothetical protein